MAHNIGHERQKFGFRQGRFRPKNGDPEIQAVAAKKSVIPLGEIGSQTSTFINWNAEV